MKRISLADLPLDYVSRETVSDVLVDLATKKRKKPFLVTYLNAYHFNLAQQNRAYRQVLKKADLVYADGWGPVWAARLLGHRLPGRLTAKDFFDDFCRKIEKGGLSIFLLGGEKKVVKKTAEILRNKYDRLNIKGFYHGYFNGAEEKLVLSRINLFRPDFLIVNVGAPKQELWLAKNLSRLNIRVGWCVGGLFDFVSKKKPSCPRWLGDLGFEWLFRLLSEPKRLWKRYLVDLPIFAVYLLRRFFSESVERGVRVKF